MSNDPFRVPDDDPNPFLNPVTPADDGQVNPYAPTSHVSETEGFESDVEAFRNRYLSHEASIKSIGLLYMVPGVLFGLIGFLGLGFFLFGLLTRGKIDGPDGDVAVAFVLLSAYLALGAAQIYAGIGLRKFSHVARRIVIVFSAIGLLGFPFGTLICAYFLYLLLGEKGRIVFSDRYQDAIRETPHIKYKTSLIVKILLVILLVFLALGFVGMFFGAGV